MNLKPISCIAPNSKVIIRLDTDLPMENQQIMDNSRLIKSLPTLKFLLQNNCKLLVIGHMGRPNGYDKQLSMGPVYQELVTLLEKEKNICRSVFLEDIKQTDSARQALADHNLLFFENLRFWPEEENNDPSFLNNLVSLADCFVNDAFAVSHRQHASLMLFKKLPGFYGLNFIAEAEAINKLIANPTRPVTVVLGGAKQDKLDYLPALERIADFILVGGKLPKLITNIQLPVANENKKIIVANLREDGLDLSQEDIEKFKAVIRQSRTIIWAGAMGMYESKDCRTGTEEIAQAIAGANGYKVVAGGDTSASIVNLGLKDNIDFICSGGGVMLQFLSKGKLPAWE